MSAENHCGRATQRRDTFHIVAAWKAAREVCASSKQSQLMRLFVPENLPSMEPARLLSIFLDRLGVLIVVWPIPSSPIELAHLNPQLNPSLEPWLSC